MNRLFRSLSLCIVLFLVADGDLFCFVSFDVLFCVNVRSHSSGGRGWDLLDYKARTLACIFCSVALLHRRCLILIEELSNWFSWFSCWPGVCWYVFVSLIVILVMSAKKCAFPRSVSFFAFVSLIVFECSHSI